MRAAFAALLVLASCAFAKAETVEIRPKAPVAQFAIPDNWKTSHIERGVQAISSDGEVYFWIEAYRPGDLQAIIDEHNSYWKEQNVSISGSDEEKHRENGVEVSMITEHATWKSAPTVLYYVEYHLGLRSDTSLVFTYWASPEGDKAFQKEVGDVLKSLEITEK